ncbi:FAD-dependent monooxygenase [Kibdelosporangium persicum]|uniref:FAD-dependent monooxygenase n=1 Tax=Kibdelosporangium persicum TaxID=2698649 RepID=UPI001564D844|nr:FAD-dependent monooxygenase [Kibdelosporangium persicum]
MGGSIAGCAAAIALRRAGCDVTVYERTSSELEDRGLGIGIPVPVHEQVVDAGYVDAVMPVYRCRERQCLILDPDEPDSQRVIYRHTFDAVVNNWGLLWRNLRDRVRDEDYHQSLAVRHVIGEPDGGTVVTDEGSERFDVVVGADGYRSLTRPLIDPEATPKYAGYVLWRGTYPESSLDGPVPAALEERLVWVGMPRGHGVFYLIPDHEPGRRRVNWGVYGYVPTMSAFDAPPLLPPGSVSDELFEVLDQSLADVPPLFAELVRSTPRAELSLHPVYDTTIRSYTAGRVLVIGDAATITRPHSGAGATKALQDAIALERVCRESDTWEQALTAYDRARRPAGNEIVELGRRLGRAQVEQPSNWARMTLATFQENLFSGTFTIKHYEAGP